jgi:nicotinamidase/pyrazinamidase
MPLREPGYDRTTALLVIDVQNDFADPGGSLAVDGGTEVIPFLNRQMAAARGSGALVVYTQDWHPASTPHFVRDGGIWPVHCVMGTWGAEFHPALVVDGPTVRKGSDGEDGYSGFSVRDPASGRESRTALDGLLRDAGIERVVIGGLATDYCVKATALDAVQLGYRTVALVDAIRAVDLAPGDGERALAEMAAAGVELPNEPAVRR